MRGITMSVEPSNIYPSGWHNHACATLDHDFSGVVNDNDILWDNGATLSYSFMDPYRGTSALQAKVHYVVKEWEKYANIKFKHVDSQDAIIRITFDNRQGSWSKLGKSELRDAVLGEPTMNLGWIEDGDAISDVERGVILHQFGHALGFGHEYHSLLREGKLTLKERTITQFFRCYGFTEQGVERQLLSPYKRLGITRSSELNFKSVMIYYMPAELNEQNQDVRPNTELSELDKAYALIRYPPDDPATKALTFGEALRATDVDCNLQDKLRKIYASRDRNPDYWGEIRIKLNVSPPPQLNNAATLTRKRLRVHPSPAWQRSYEQDSDSDETGLSSSSEGGSTPELSPEAQAIKAGFERILGGYNSNDQRCLYGYYGGEIPVSLKF